MTRRPIRRSPERPNEERNMATTMKKNLIVPEVMADMITAKIPNMIVATPFAKIDNTLVGKPGDTVTIPQYKYIGDAEDVAEGVKAETVLLTADTTQVTVKKAMKAVELTDEAVESGYGNPVGEATTQLAKSIAAKIDNDVVSAITDEDQVQLKYHADAPIGYTGITMAVDAFDEEFNSEKVIFIHPDQRTQLRLDPDFLSADKYDHKVIETGDIGIIANFFFFLSRKVQLKDCNYLNPIIKLNNEPETEDDAAAVTIYMKRDVNLETERDTLARKTILSVDEMYTAALSNTAKVVLAYFPQNDPDDVTTLTVSPESVTVEKGAEQVMTINTEADDFTMESADPETATVDKASKKVTGVEVGNTTVTITAEKTGKAKATKTIPVEVTAAE